MNQKTICLILCGFLLAPFLSAQTLVDDYYQKIEKKLVFDKKYLNVYSISYQPAAQELPALKNIPRAVNSEKITFESKDNIIYQFFFIKESLELDSLVLLSVKKIEDKAGGGESFFGNTGGGPQIDTSTILSFTDLQELYFSGSPFYSALYTVLVTAVKRDEPAYLLGVKLNEKASKSKGITSPDNTDFLNYARANSIHKYPVFTDEVKKPVSGRRRGAAPVDSAATGGEYKIDASFSYISFFHKIMDLGFSSVSAELNTEAKAMNISAWQSMSLTMGVRSIFFVSNFSQPNPKNDFMIDAKVMGRMRLNTYNLSGSLPFVFAEKPKLHVGSGIIFDVTGTRTFGLPFFNVYLAAGSSSVDNPYVKFGPPDSSHAYFSFKQWETSMSFFWNASEEKAVRYRFDVGAGNYDVYKAEYVKNAVSKTLLYNKIKPILKMSINFSPQNVDFLGVSAKLYDNILGFNLWLRLLELPGQHTFRLETTFNSTPILRSPYEWETPGGSSSIQLRYRLGF